MIFALKINIRKTVIRHQAYFYKYRLRVVKWTLTRKESHILIVLVIVDLTEAVLLEYHYSRIIKWLSGHK
jgi:hypothetical protein